MSYDHNCALSTLSMISPRERVVKVAVVGSGLAGLTAAYLLSNVTSTSGVQFEVHLFEKV